MWMQWDQLIIDAIEQRRTLKFRYHNEVRLAEPHTFGRDKNEHKALSAYQINKGWRFFHLADMREVTTGDHFPAARPGYVRFDSRMEHIWAQL